MVNISKEEEQKIKKVTANYDKSLHDLLLAKGVNITNVKQLLEAGSQGYTYSIQMVESNTIDEVASARALEKDNGVVFSLPSGRKDGKSFIIWTYLSSDELKRFLNMKAFL